MIKKVILVSYYFPPKKAVGCIRNQAIADSFLKMGYDVTVITTQEKKAPNLPYKTYRIKSIDLKSYLRNNDRGDSKKFGRLKNTDFRKRLTETFPFNLFFGEGGIIYIVKALLILWKYKNKEAILYSSFSPLADHYICYLAKKINKNILWIADFRDVIIDYDSIQVWWPKFHWWIHKRMAQNADIVSVVSEGLKSYFRDFNQNIVVVRNGITKIKDLSVNNFLSKEYFNISYTGALYVDRRNPSLLFEALQKIRNNHPYIYKKIRVNYAGQEGRTWDNLCKEYGINDICNNFGLISREQALCLQRDSQVNLLLSWTSKHNRGILTGKFFEYLETGNPILCILTGDGDIEFETIFKKLKYSNLYYTHQSSSAVNDFVLFLFDQWKAGNYDKIYISEVEKKPYYWEEGFKNLSFEIERQL